MSRNVRRAIVRARPIAQTVAAIAGTIVATLKVLRFFGLI